MELDLSAVADLSLWAYILTFAGGVLTSLGPCNIAMIPLVIAFVGGALLVSLLTGRFQPGFYGQPGAHTDLLWSGLGMLLVGWISALIGGCPFRQLVKSGEGDSAAGLVVIGMLLGGGIVQSWEIAATSSGVSTAGKAAVLVGLMLVTLVTLKLREDV